MRNIFAILLLTACGGESIKELPLGHQQKEQAPDPKRLEERRKQREAEAKAEQTAEAAKMAALDAACTGGSTSRPSGAEGKPKQLDAACAAVGEAWDAFMQKRYADDADVIAKWNESKNDQLPFALTQCKRMGSIEVAACQANALANLPLEIEAEAPEVMAHCAQTCGKDLPPVQMPQ
jgi:hypothetical protein